MLSMITKKSEGFESHDLIQPTLGLKRVDNDLALFIRICLYSGFGSTRLALPKLQYIINPRSCVCVLYSSLAKLSIERFASASKASSCPCSYKFNKVPA